MTISATDLSGRPAPLYRALADVLGERIRSGQLAAGSRMPTQRSLAHSLGITVGTVGRAYALAERRGHLVCEVGRGSYVRAPAAAVHRTRDLVLPETMASGHIDLRINAPSPLPIDAQLAAELALLAEDQLPLLRSYSPGAGLARHREAAAAWLAANGLQSSADRIVITGGAQAGAFLALAVMTQPGDVVLVEQVAYPGFREIGDVLRLRLEGVPMDTDGMNPEAFAERAAGTGARVVVMVPDLHNPTTVQMPGKRRLELIEVAERSGLQIVEDAVYRPLAEGGDAPPLAALAPDRVVHIASLSKGVLPALRMGFVSAPPHMIPQLARATHAMRVGELPLAAELFLQWAEKGLLEKAAADQRREARARQEMAALHLNGFEYVTRPTALHLWLRLPEAWSAFEAEQALAKRGVLTAPADLFWFDSGAPPAALRLSLGRPPDRVQLEKALAIVGATLTGQPMREAAVV